MLITWYIRQANINDIINQVNACSMRKVIKRRKNCFDKEKKRSDLRMMLCNHAASAVGIFVYFSVCDCHWCAKLAGIIWGWWESETFEIRFWSILAWTEAETAFHCVVAWKRTFVAEEAEVRRTETEILWLWRIYCITVITEYFALTLLRWTEA